VMETVGEATWTHSVRSCKPGGRIVISGATSGDAPPAQLTRIFFLQQTIVGSTMGTRDELDRLIAFCVQRDLRPQIHATMALADAREGFAQMLAGDVVGKIVFTTG
jgi:D-arabinose 1-dehydrogenase-like Zn-dependent alcohol dehydrogenase